VVTGRECVGKIEFAVDDRFDFVDFCEADLILGHAATADGDGLYAILEDGFAGYARQFVDTRAFIGRNPTGELIISALPSYAQNRNNSVSRFQRRFTEAIA
jgi:hypothetical protein